MIVISRYGKLVICELSQRLLKSLWLSYLALLLCGCLGEKCYLGSKYKFWYHKYSPFFIRRFLYILGCSGLRCATSPLACCRAPAAVVLLRERQTRLGFLDAAGCFRAGTDRNKTDFFSYWFKTIYVFQEQVSYQGLFFIFESNENHGVTLCNLSESNLVLVLLFR